MRSSIIVIFLALSVTAASAQCVAQAPAATNAAAPALPAAPRGGELLATAAAATTDTRIVMYTSATRPTQPPATAKDDTESGTGAAMLFAAVALMSGIALRRYIAPSQ